MSTFSIRSIQQKDNPSVANVIRQVMTAFGAVGAGFSIEDPEVDAMFESYDQPRSRFYVVVDEDDVVHGCGGLAPLAGRGNDTCELRKMYFLETCRGLGLGRQMMEMILANARDFGFAICYLETLKTMQAANRLYRKTGFEEIRQAMGNTGHCGCDAYFVKRL